MSAYKIFANHPKQIVKFQQDRRVARIKDGKLGTFKWRPCPGNGHNDTAGSWAFEMDDGEVVFLNGYTHDTYPWRIPNRFRHATDGELMMVQEVPVEWEPTIADYNTALICDLLDMIVDENVKTEDYNYVVERLQAMLAAA